MLEVLAVSQEMSRSLGMMQEGSEGLEVQIVWESGKCRRATRQNIAR